MKEGLIAVANAGSTSLKFGVYQPQSDRVPLERARGSIERAHGHVLVHARDPAGVELTPPTLPDNMAERLESGSLGEVLVQWVEALFPGVPLEAVGHRVVHGGDGYPDSIRVTAHDLGTLAQLTPLAPLHQPANLALIRELMQLRPDVLQVASFDTSFHLTNERLTRTYALPLHWYDEGLRRYGFHGLSYRYVAATLQSRLPAGARRLVVAHLGGGCSVCGLIDGVSATCSTGLTALDGVPMATRSGALDPGAVLYLLLEKGIEPKDVSAMLYTRSGLLGLSGISGDVRALLASREAAARDALAVFVRRAAREIAAIAGEIGGLDALAFTGGIGENATELRAQILQRLAWLGISLDPAANQRAAEPTGTQISAADSAVSCWAIATDEESVIARDTAALLISSPGR